MRCTALLLPLFSLMFLVVPVAAEELRPVRCQFNVLVHGWQGNVDCFELTVTEDRQSINAQTIDLTIHVLNARSPSDQDPLFYFGGGPGVSAAYYVNILLRHPIRENRSIIIMDQRGVGQSGELCPDMRANYYRRVASRRSNDTRRRQLVGLLRRCLGQASQRGQIVEAYSTLENAADVDDVRAAFGLEQIDVWAVSYGTILAQEYIRQQPDRIGALVLDGTVPIDFALEEQVAENLQRTLMAYWQDCLDVGDCREGDVSYYGRLLELIPDFNRSPMRLLGFSPEPSVVVNYVYVTGSDVAQIVFALMYQRANHQQIDRLLGLLERRSGSFLRAYYQRLSIPGFSYGMHYAVNCQGAYLDETSAAAENAAYPEIANSFDVGFFAELCPELGLFPAEDANAPVFHDGRVLVISGDRDPITPLHLSDPLRDRFPNAGFLEIAGGGHGPSRDIPCAQEIVRSYFENPDAPVLDICGLVVAENGP